MQSKKGISWAELRVGVFVIIGFTLLLIGILMIGKRSGFLARSYSLHTHFDNAAGLVEGAPVWLAGIEVGEVSKISIEEKKGLPHIRIDMKVRRDVKEKIRQDSHARIANKGLLGDKLIEISLGSPGEPVVEEGGRIEGVVNPTGVPELLESTEAMVSGLKVTLDAIQAITRKVNEGTGTLGLLVNDEALYHNLQEASEKLDRLAGSLEGEKFKEASVQLSTLLEKINAGEGTLGRAVQDKALYESLREAAEELKALIHDIREHPKNYLTVKIF